MKKITHSLILVLNIISAAALLFSYLAPLINPANFVLPALFGLAYPYLLMINMVFVLFWMLHLKKEVLISLLVILIGWNHLNNLLPLSGKNHNVPETLNQEELFKVLSYNVRGFDRYHHAKDPDAKNAIFNFISEESPAILCLQEYYTSDRSGQRQADYDQLLKPLKHSAVHYSNDPANRRGFGIATYSDFPIVKRSRIPFNSSSNAAMYTDHLVAGDTLRVFNIHLQSIMLRKENYDFIDTARLKYSNEQVQEIRSIGSSLSNAFVQRASQADMIANYIQESPHPVLVMGDFNDTPQSYSYRKIRKGLKDAFRKAGKGFGHTYAGELPSFRIDYILTGEGMSTYNFRRIKKDCSDHFPITCLVQFPEPKPVAEPEPEPSGQ